MKVLIIASNVGSINDGVGGYAKYLADAIKQMDNIDKVYIENGNTDNLSSIGKMLSMKMSSAITRAIRLVDREEIDVVIVEYPFKEYNPLIIPLLKKLKKKLNKRNGKFVLSLHEYFRAKPMRQKVMRKIADYSDVMFVTEEKIKEFFEGSGKSVYIRDIPSIIPVKWADNEFKDVSLKRFTYFGLIIANKAFDEMIQAWKIFNANGEYDLDIITSSEVHIEESEKYKINIIQNLDDESVSVKMKETTYCILPIKPEVGPYNTTFKTATRSGCTIIGHFCNEFCGEKFVVNTEDYTIENFVRALNQAVSLTPEELIENAKQSIEFGERYSFKFTANQIIGELI